MGKKGQVKSVKKPLLGPENLEPRIRWQKNMVKLKKRCLSFNRKGKSMTEHVDRSLSYDPVQETISIREYLTPKLPQFELRKTFTQATKEPVTASLIRLFWALIIFIPLAIKNKHENKHEWIMVSIQRKCLVSRRFS